MSRQKRAMNITSSVKTMTRIQCECLFGFIIVERGRYTTTHTHTRYGQLRHLASMSSFVLTCFEKIVMSSELDIYIGIVQCT